MDDLISREQAIDALDKDPMGGLNYNRILNSLPSAQKTGHWIIFPPCFEEICMCSNCKTKFKEAYQHSDTCPSCGARMEV